MERFLMRGLTTASVLTIQIATGLPVQAAPVATDSEVQQALMDAVKAYSSGISADKTASTVEGFKPLTTAQEGRVIVRLKPGVEPRQFVTAFVNANSGVSLEMTKNFSLNQPSRVGIDENATDQYIVLVKSTNMSTERLVLTLKQDASVDLAEPDQVMSISATPNDPQLNELWGLNNIGQTGGTPGADIAAFAAWDKATGSQSVVVGVIDTGVAYLHQDLVDNIWSNPNEIPNDGIDNDGNGWIDDIHGINPAYGSSDPWDDHGHGTHVSGTIGAVGNNGEGVVGVNWQVKIAACKSLDASGYGWTSDAIECVNYFNGLKMDGINIVATNNSWGGGGYSDLLKEVIDTAGSLDIIFVAAAGNDTEDTDVFPHYPSSYDSSNIVSVAATDHNDELAWFSNWGATSVDLAAPGESILSTLPGSATGGCAVSGNPLFSDDFDSGIDNWGMLGYYTYSSYAYPISNDPSLWWGLYTDDYASSPYSLSDSPMGSYIDYSLSSAYRHFDLSGTPAGGLCGTLLVKGNSEETYDYLNIYISNDNGASWSLTGVSANGDYMDWTPLSFTIPENYQTADFMVALVKTNDCCNDYGIEYDGYLVDNLEIGTGVSSYVGEYGVKSGTSMATPHVTGAIALAASMLPNETASQRISRVLDNVDVLPSLTDLMVTGGRLDVNDTLPDTPAISVRGDFNGDGKPDLVWRDPTTGANALWYMDNNTRIGTASIVPSVAGAWEIVGTNDFNGDGKPDLVWRNPATGQNVLWYMNDKMRTGTAYMPTLTGAWEIVGTNDFNGDSKPDLVWRNPVNGQNALWYMNDKMRTGTAYMPTLTGAWEIVGTNDFNGDSKPDLVWRNPVNGQNALWYMNDNARIGTAYMPTLTGAWEIVGTNDFNGDGKPDLVWRNPVNGQNALWYMNDNARIGTAYMPTLTGTWEIVGD